MYNDQPIFIPILLLIFGFAILFNRKKVSEDQVKNHEKYIRGGKPATKFEVAGSKYSIILGGVFTIGLGGYFLIKMISGN